MDVCFCLCAVLRVIKCTLTRTYSCSRCVCVCVCGHRNGKFANPEFIALMGFVQSCQAAFSAFDANKSGTINLNLGQFLYACSKTR